jgi:hypothetical protein|uniref:J domain-containing protein n=1 Tax=viral metagenome TaxID=1070528 RepID=A0A6C0IMG1_9ZZZZ
MKKTCPKSGIKIHETPSQIQTHSSNLFSVDDFTNKHFSPQITTSNIDLDIENYSCDDLFILLGIQGRTLDEPLMKNVKKVVLKTHPDKSNLHSDYYIFYSKAYNRLHSIYIAQNKTAKSINNFNNDYNPANSDEKEKLLNNLFETNNNFKNPKKFNKWFNDKFEKHHVKEEEHGYGDWLKSDEGVAETAKISQSQLGSEMEKYKQRIQGIIPYQGIQDTFSSSSIVSGDGFSDLKQAYEESVIPVTQQDYNKMKKFNGVDDYTNFRDNQHKNVKPMSEQNAYKFLKKKNRDLEDQCVAMTYENIKHTEKQREQNKLFWSDLKRLT